MLTSRQKQCAALKEALEGAVRTRASSDLATSLKGLLTAEELDANYLKGHELLLVGMLQLHNLADDAADPSACRQAVSKKWSLESRDPKKFRATLGAFVGGAVYAEMTKAQLALESKGRGSGTGSYKRPSRAARFDDVPGGVDASRLGSMAPGPAGGGSGGQSDKGDKKGRGGKGGSGGGGASKGGRA